MDIAIQAADLDHARIDGTRVYIKELLARFGALSQEDHFYLYHRSAWNVQLAPPQRGNYHERVLTFPFYWTQTRFLYAMMKTRPDVLWMPMQSLPFVTPRMTRTVVTIHDVAFKIYPTFFPPRDRRRLNLFTDFAVTHADHIIAVSQATKSDLLHFYSNIAKENITVIHHGFSAEMFAQNVSQEECTALREKYAIGDAPYILYVGALQPRKNLATLVRAFNHYAAKNAQVQLVLVGGKGWLWESILREVERSPYRERIVLTGSVPFADLRVFYQNAHVFAFPSLYEGFGIPLLEAFAAGVPVVSARNSSLTEVSGGDVSDGGAAFLCRDVSNAEVLAQCLARAVEDEALRAVLIARGQKRVQDFAWDRCAQETLQVLRGV